LLSRGKANIDNFPLYTYRFVIILACMFGIGLPEMIIILVVALLVVGPSKLPELARTLGKAFSEFRRMADEVKETFEEEVLKEEGVQAAESTGEVKIEEKNQDEAKLDETNQDGVKQNETTQSEGVSPSVDDDKKST